MWHLVYILPNVESSKGEGREEPHEEQTGSVFKSYSPSTHTIVKIQKIICWKSVAYSLATYKNKVRLIIHTELLISLYYG